MFATRQSLISKKSISLLINQSIIPSRGIKWFAKNNHYAALSSIQPEPGFNTKRRRIQPKQPVPDLNASIAKYLSSLKPILAPEEFSRTQTNAVEFLKDKNAFKLQNILENMAVSKENWIHEFYVDEYYLKVKLPLPIYSNPAKLMKNQNFKNEDSFLKYTTSLIKAVFDFKSRIDMNELEVDKASSYRKGQELCMDQYTKLFSSYRAPGVEKDEFLVYNDDLSNQYIIVMSKNQLYKIDLVVNWRLIDELDLFHQLKFIRNESKTNLDKSLDLGLLSSLPRDEWAIIRNNLKNDPLNCESLEFIEKSAFLICLDDKIETNKYANENIKNGNQILNGCGSQFNSANRWFDKTLQFVISEDGVCGLLREHSPSEGPITVRLIDHVYDYMKKPRFLDLSESYPFSKPKKLTWTNSEYLETEIEKARVKFDNLIEDFDLNVFEYKKFGRAFPKSLNMSPDSFLQVALQLAYFKVYETLPVHISIGSMRRFHKGRVDYIRATNMDSLKWCLSMMPNSHSTNDEKYFLLHEAVDTQAKTMLDTILGNGFDCHLTALKTICSQENMPMPKMFSDSSFEFNNQIKLLTSQVTTDFDGTFSCFGPNVHNGYTSTYNYKPDNILFTLSSFKSCKTNSVKDLTEAFSKSLDQVFSLCNQFTNRIE